MADQLSVETIQEIRDVFAQFDKDRTETISLKELGMALRAAGQNPTEADIMDMMNEVDSEGTGTIEFQEFLVLVARKMNEYIYEEELKVAFQIFDRDGSGYISAVEMRILMCSLGDKLSDEEMNELLGECDMDMEGNINYEEFVKKLVPPKGEISAK
eukprot:NODE_6676_length_827_cov_50.204545_g6440_i0.p1 GENE.NODE_6676_length_827_cov_50.204545_g6440_i0~~NODE_6676_length_827_cov_50.204545_g6440_i0.p1  ORF type:complete len:157 (-),score=47.79 NODE_6676_length_827_cov_50.204545_g6440_i0:239-709(-)